VTTAITVNAKTEAEKATRKSSEALATPRMTVAAPLFHGHELTFAHEHRLKHRYKGDFLIICALRSATVSLCSPAIAGSRCAPAPEIGISRLQREECQRARYRH